MVSYNFSCKAFLLLVFAVSLVKSFAKDMPPLEPKTIENVVIAIAMEAEAMPFVKHLQLNPVDEFFPKQAPFLAFQGIHEACNVTVITNGKDETYGTGVDNCGTVPAAMAVFLALQKLEDSVDLVINAGTCGGFSRKGAAIGDVFVTTGSAHHDRRIPIPSFVEYGVGKLDSVPASELAKSIGAKMGVCSTGNSLDKTETDDKHMLANDASVKDMEIASIAWACELHDTPHFGVKVVTDIVDGDRPTQDEFLENLHTAAESLQSALPKVIEHVCGRPHDEL